MMKVRRAFISIFFISVVFLLSIVASGPGHVASAALTILAPKNPETVMTNGYFPVMIYSNPACTQATGKALDPKITSWRVTRESIDDSSATFWQSYDLGNNQWVKYGQVFFKIEPVAANPEFSDVLEIYTNGNKLPVYNNPQLSRVTGYLNPKIRDWAVTRYALTSPDNVPGRYDLGNNQWVDALGTADFIRTTYQYEVGTQLYDQNGTPTDTIANAGAYRVFGVTTINGHVYVKLGTDNQWVKLEHSVFG